jgi:hypothetical protein
VNVQPLLRCCFALTILAAVTSSDHAQDANSSALAIRVAFQCKWWSPAEMEGLNPDNPPAKTTTVVIKKWEYSDPIGVPHPDVVDAEITIQNTTGRTQRVALEATIAWKIGARGRERYATWQPDRNKPVLTAIAIEAHASKDVRVPMNVAGAIARAEKQQEWPFAGRIEITARTDSGTGAKTIVELPIRPGD